MVDTQAAASLLHFPYHPDYLEKLELIRQHLRPTAGVLRGMLTAALDA